MANEADNTKVGASPIGESFSPRSLTPATKTELAESPTIKIEKDIRSGERWLIGIGAASVVISLIMALIYYGQLKQMREATKATKIAAEAARDSVTISQSSLAANIENFRLDQRAWLGIENIKAMPEVPETGKTFTVTTVLRNSGKTPAKDIVMQNGATPLSKLPNANTMCVIALKKHESQTILPPNGLFNNNLPMTEGNPLSQGWEAALKERKVYAYGCVLYNDISGKHHWLTYCGVLDFPSKSFQACPHYNDTGDGTPPS